MQAAMSASPPPTVQVNNGRYAVATAVQDRERQRRLAEQMRNQVEGEHVE
jgi:hypothetical protein